MHRFLTEPDKVRDGMITITGDDAKHMLQVLRFKTGDIFHAFDGSGTEYEAELSETGKNSVTGRIIRSYRPETEPKTRVILFQGVPKADKMDWIVQKAVELGVWLIVPVITGYSVQRMKDKSLDGKLQRWNRISQEACKQSRRVVVPAVREPLSWTDALKLWLDMTENSSEVYGMPVFCYENEGKKCLKDHIKCYNIDRVNTVGVFIGPEGGFSGEEAEMAERYGIHPVNLGRRILRTETAAIAVLSVIMHEMSELKA